MKKPIQTSIIFPLLIPTSIKNNLDKNCPYNGLEHEVSSLRKEGNILLMGYFNARTSSNKFIVLSNYSNPNNIWLDKDLELANRYERSSKDIGENLFGYEMDLKKFRR